MPTQSHFVSSAGRAPDHPFLRPKRGHPTWHSYDGRPLAARGRGTAPCPPSPRPTSKQENKTNPKPQHTHSKQFELFSRFFPFPPRCAARPASKQRRARTRLPNPPPLDGARTVPLLAGLEERHEAESGPAPESDVRFFPTTRTPVRGWRGFGCVLVFLQTGRAVLKTQRFMG